MAYQLSESDLWQRRYGQPVRPRHGRLVTAGPLSARLDDGDVLDLGARDLAVATRLGVRVRSRDWGTVANAVQGAALRECADGFKWEFAARSVGGEIDFEWSATVTGRGDGSLEYTFSGVARRSFPFARIGLCVLLPTGPYAGRPYSASRTLDVAGASRGRLPELVAPPDRRGDVEYPLFPGFRTFEVELSCGVRVSLAFNGDILELEDQRNWTDGTFKVYSSSVTDALPRWIEAGQRVEQSLEFAVSVPAVPSRPRSVAPGSTVSVGARLGETLPRLGAAATPSSGLAAEEATRLRELRLDHVRVELNDDAATADALTSGVSIASMIDAWVELVLLGSGRHVERLVTLLGECEPFAAARVIVVPGGLAVTTRDDLDAVRRQLPEWLSGVPLVGGTDSDFAELNAARPDVRRFDGLTYSMNPQVHDSDEQALRESLSGQLDAARTAATIASGRPVHISPITLRPRTQDGDPRQFTSFAAGWTLASIRHLAVARVASATYFELTGPRGLLPPGDAASPVLDVLRWIAQRQGAPVLDVRSTGTLASLHTLALETPRGVEALCANLDPSPHRVVVNDGVARRAELTIEPFEVATIAWKP
jgi:D-apionolactonase